MILELAEVSDLLLALLSLLILVLTHLLFVFFFWFRCIVFVRGCVGGFEGGNVINIEFEDVLLSSDHFKVITVVRHLGCGYWSYHRNIFLILYRLNLLLFLGGVYHGFIHKVGHENHVS